MATSSELRMSVSMVVTQCEDTLKTHLDVEAVTGVMLSDEKCEEILGKTTKKYLEKSPKKGIKFLLAVLKKLELPGFVLLLESLQRIGDEKHLTALTTIATHIEYLTLPTSSDKLLTEAVDKLKFIRDAHFKVSEHPDVPMDPESVNDDLETPTLDAPTRVPNDSVQTTVTQIVQTKSTTIPAHPEASPQQDSEELQILTSDAFTRFSYDSTKPTAIQVAETVSTTVQVAETQLMTKQVAETPSTTKQVAKIHSMTKQASETQSTAMEVSESPLATVQVTEAPSITEQIAKIPSMTKRFITETPSTTIQAETPSITKQLAETPPAIMQVAKTLSTIQVAKTPSAATQVGDDDFFPDASLQCSDSQLGAIHETETVLVKKRGAILHSPVHGITITVPPSAVTSQDFELQMSASLETSVPIGEEYILCSAIVTLTTNPKINAFSDYIIVSMPHCAVSMQDHPEFYCMISHTDGESSFKEDTSIEVDFTSQWGYLSFKTKHFTRFGAAGRRKKRKRAVTIPPQKQQIHSAKKSKSLEHHYKPAEVKPVRSFSDSTSQSSHLPDVRFRLGMFTPRNKQTPWKVVFLTCLDILTGHEVSPLVCIICDIHAYCSTYTVLSTHMSKR